MKILSVKTMFCLVLAVSVHMLTAQPTNSGLYDVAVLDTSTIIVVGGNGTLLRTTDGGNNWTQQINSAKTFTAVHFIDKNIGWVVGEDGVIRKTTNSGRKWLRQTLNARILQDVFFVNLQVGWVVGVNGVIAKTIDGGESWENQLSGTTGYFESVFFFDADTGWAVGRYPANMKTIDGGKTWLPMQTQDWDFLSVFFVNAEKGWAVGFGQSIAVSMNGGNNWALQTPMPSRLGSSRGIFFIDEKQGWIVGNDPTNRESGRVIATVDSGQTWRAQFVIPNTALWGIDFIDRENGWVVGEKGVMLKTTDGGQTWRQVTGQLVGVEEQHESLPVEFNLRQNYPNPFRIEGVSGQATTLTYTLSCPAYVSMAVYDVLGRAVAVLVEETKPAGVFQASWNGRDHRQQPAATGIYFCRMEITESNTRQQIFQQKKMLVLE